MWAVHCMKVGRLICPVEALEALSIDFELFKLFSMKWPIHLILENWLLYRNVIRLFFALIFIITKVKYYEGISLREFLLSIIIWFNFLFFIFLQVINIFLVFLIFNDIQLTLLASEKTKKRFAFRGILIFLYGYFI